MLQHRFTSNSSSLKIPTLKVPVFWDGILSMGNGSQVSVTTLTNGQSHTFIFKHKHSCDWSVVSVLTETLKTQQQDEF